MREMRNSYKHFIGGPEGKEPLVRPQRRWEADIKVDFTQMNMKV